MKNRGSAVGMLRRVSGLSPLLLCVVLIGCSTPQKRSSTLPITAHLSQASLLYIRNSPHDRLHVEIDAVEGCVPSDRTLSKVREFLSAHCSKPRGIEIVRSDVIPIDIARGLPEKALARRYINGPPSSASDAAFIYVLFYDDKLCVASTHSGGANSVTHPYTDVQLYPAVYFNVRYFPGLMKNHGLIHETGHLLGVGRRPDHTSNLHCTGATCLMNATLRMHRWFIGLQRGLCSRCKDELAKSSDTPPPNNLRYMGPVLVRSESNYHVLTLPDRVNVVVGPLDQSICTAFASAFRDQAPATNRQAMVMWIIDENIHSDPLKMEMLREELKQDPLKLVRELAL